MKKLIVALLLTTGLASGPAGHATAKAKQSVSGTYSCSCFSGNTVVSGTCSTKSTGSGSVECGKHSGDTCTATCKMATFQQGADGGSIALSPGTTGARAKGGVKLRKAQ